MTAPSEEQVRECARVAIARIRETGWGQGRHGVVDQKKTCLVVSLAPPSDRFGSTFAGREVRHRVAALLGLDNPIDCYEHSNVVVWNDRAGRTADEVIAVLERVAAGEGATDYLATTTT